MIIEAVHFTALDGRALVVMPIPSIKSSWVSRSRGASMQLQTVATRFPQRSAR